MSKSNLTPNINMLSPGNFKVTIDTAEFANTTFFCTNASLPSISQAGILSSFRNRNIYVPGDTTEYGALGITFIVDENMKNYIEMHNWITTNSSEQPKYKDLTLSILTNKNTTNRQLLFHDVFPTDVSELTFTTQDTAVEYITCSVTFQYNMYEFIK